MKRTFWILATILLVATARATTNDLTGLLQKGLFEEEANRNLDSAISNYQSLATAFDKDRQVAATAIFRLGECYRKLGRTNDAAAQYERLVRDFSDQQTLVTLSRQNLTGMGAAPQEQRPVENNPATLLKSLRTLSRTQLEQVLPTLVPDAMLNTLLQDRAIAQQKLIALGKDYATNHPSYITAAAQVDDLTKQISERVAGIMQALEIRANLPKSTAATQTAETATTDEEEKEIRRIQQLIQNSPDLINAPNENVTPLSSAARQDQLRVATFLLDHGADIEKGAGRLKPLVAAAENGHKAMVELLLQRGAGVNGDPSSGITPLSIAAHKGFVAVTEVLLAHKVNVNGDEAPLISAAQNGHAKIIQMLLAAGAKVDREYNGRTALSFAAENGSLDAIKTLLDAKADPNLGKLDLPLLCAIYYKSIQAAELLLKAGANPNVKGEVNYSLTIDNRYYSQNSLPHASVTPLWLAVNQSQNPAIVKLLLKFKADPDDSRTDGRAVAFSALYNSQPEFLKLILDGGANANAQDNTTDESPTLLDRAIFNTNAIKLLLDHGAAPNLRNGNGITPLIHAAQYYSQVDPSVFEMLLDHKADPNLTSPAGQTALDIVKSGVGQPGGISLSGGMTAVEAKARAVEVANLLRQHGALDQLPDFNAIRVTRQGAPQTMVFQRASNDWNHFTLLEALLNFYQNSGIGGLMIPGPGVRIINNQMPSFPFPDLTRLAILHPIRGTTNSTRTVVNLLNATNGIDCSKDVPLDFGDTVEIPEREHSLAERAVGLMDADRDHMINCRKGFAKLNVRNRTVDILLYPFDTSKVGTVLGRNEAQAALMASSDLAHVKVIRRNGPGGKKQEWVLDCSDLNKAPDLWIRDGDLIEVPEK